MTNEHPHDEQLEPLTADECATVTGGDGDYLLGGNPIQDILDSLKPGPTFPPIRSGPLL